MDDEAETSSETLSESSEDSLREAVDDLDLAVASGTLIHLNQGGDFHRSSESRIRGESVRESSNWFKPRSDL